jgi:hypothetical protein
MSKHLTHEEARAVLVLSNDPNWALYKDFITRNYIMARNECESVKADHRFHQGAASELKDMVGIETKAKNILSGH